MILLFINNCEKDNSFEQKIIFEYFYNVPFGGIYTGWIVNNEGKIYSYNHPQKWNHVDENSFISLNNLNENLDYCDSVIYEIDENIFSVKSSLIEFISDTFYSNRECPGADRGLMIYCCYKFNPSNSLYKQVWLSEEGDCHMKNLDPKAIELNMWMKDIQREIGLFPVD
jgi:hypothetical protein